MYALIFNSGKPQAREFRHWVTDTVLPSVRKTRALRLAADQADRAVKAAGTAACVPTRTTGMAA